MAMYFCCMASSIRSVVSGSKGCEPTACVPVALVARATDRYAPPRLSVIVVIVAFSAILAIRHARRPAIYSRRSSLMLSRAAPKCPDRRCDIVGAMGGGNERRTPAHEIDAIVEHRQPEWHTQMRRNAGF